MREEISPIKIIMKNDGQFDSETFSLMIDDVIYQFQKDPFLSTLID